MIRLFLFVTLLSTILVFETNVAFAAKFTLQSGPQIEIVEEPFNNTFKVLGCSDKDKTCLINGHIPFGSDATLPKTFVKRIGITYRGQSYSLDVSDMYNAWGSRPLEVKGVVRYFGGKCFDAKNCQFRGIFSDGAGSFVAEWKIINGIPLRTVLTNSSDIMNLFLHHIDPPEFE